MSDNDLLLDLGPNTSGDEDVDYAAPRTPSYCPPADTEEHMMEDEQNDANENSPPPSQPRPPARNTNENNPRDQKQPENRGIKRKYVDHQSMEAKIAKTEDSILKLERHLNNRTCSKSLQYSAKANIAPDSAFQKEIKDIKQTAEQALVNTLTSFHKRRLDSLGNKLESRPTFSSRKRTHVNRQSRSESQSASNIVNNDNVKLAELEKRIIDLTNIVSTHVISTNKRAESYNIVFYSLNHQQPPQTFLRAIAYQETKGVECAKKTPHTGAKPHKGRLIKNFYKIFQATNSLTTKSA